MLPDRRRMRQLLSALRSPTGWPTLSHTYRKRGFHMTPADLLKAVRAAHGIPSNYRLARVLGVTDKTVQRWQAGENAPDGPTCERLAVMAGFDPDFVVAAMQAHREREPSERARWERIAQRLQSVAAAVACVILSGLITGSPDAQARASIEETARAPHCAPLLSVLYIVRNWLRRLGAVADKSAAWFLQSAPA